MSTFDYDLFVIGGGSGGVRAGRVAAESGARVALAEEFRMGGTCVIRGCVPKKLMVFASKFGPATGEARDWGWDMGDGTFDWSKFRPNLHAELSRLENIYRTNLARPGTDIYDARATLTDAHTVALSNGQSYTAKHILVATGGRPFIPDLPGAETGITSNEVFNLDRLPKKILIVGGGYIACEFACILNGLGTHVTQWHRGPQVLRGFDDEVRGHIAELMLAQGIDPVAHRLEEHTRKKLAAANTFEAVAREWWEDVHRHEVSTGQAERNRRRLELHVYPHLATDPIAGINAQRLLGVLRRLERRGIVATAHRTKDVCSQVFEFAIATGRADANPAKALGRRALRPAKVKHHPAVTDPAQLAQLLRGIDAHGGEPTTMAALKLVPILFPRPGELRTARWEDFDQGYRRSAGMRHV